MSGPPLWAIRAAELAAMMSPCAKSKRGVVIFIAPDLRYIASEAFNRPPKGVDCDGSEACRASCGKRCLHAEHIALRDLQLAGRAPHVFDLVHVKVGADGRVVAGGGPSCWQCAREVLDSGIGGVWLYELPTVSEANAAGVVRADDSRHVELARWKRYTAVDFYRTTCAATGVHYIVPTIVEDDDGPGIETTDEGC